MQWEKTPHTHIYTHVSYNLIPVSTCTHSSLCKSMQCLYMHIYWMYKYSTYMHKKKSCNISLTETHAHPLLKQSIKLSYAHTHTHTHRESVCNQRLHVMELKQVLHVEHMSAALRCHCNEAKRVVHERRCFIRRTKLLEYQQASSSSNIPPPTNHHQHTSVLADSLNNCISWDLCY